MPLSSVSIMRLSSKKTPTAALGKLLWVCLEQHFPPSCLLGQGRVGSDLTAEILGLWHDRPEGFFAEQENTEIFTLQKKESSVWYGLALSSKNQP